MSHPADEMVSPQLQLLAGCHLFLATPRAQDHASPRRCELEVSCLQGRLHNVDSMAKERRKLKRFGP